jgi:hypothetical protein
MNHEGLIRTLLLGGDSLIDNPYRLGSDKWGEFVREARELYEAGELNDLDEDSYHLLESDAGELAEFEGQQVMLEVPTANFDKSGWAYVYVFDGEKIQRLDFQASVTNGEDVTFD